MGSVWRAEHLGWEAPVAIKLMNRDVADQPEARARFEREVRLAAGLRSPHVVQVLDHGVDEATRIPFITMELLEGESLDARLRRQGCLSPAETLELVSQVVRALSRAHEAGVVHRDLKPENLFLVRNDEQSLVKILDFGIAKGSRAGLAARLTRPGRVLGTPFYMSPEQFRGTREIDHRADLWSLSAITCECLTGRRPFEAKDIGELALLLLRNSGRSLPSALGTVPAGFDAWFLRATHPEIEQRFQTARELGNALTRVCGGSAPRLAAAIGPTEELPTDGDGEHGSRLRSGTRWRAPARVLGLGLLVSVPVAAGAVWQYHRQKAAHAADARPAAALASAPEVATLALRPAPAAASAPAAPTPAPVMAEPPTTAAPGSALPGISPAEPASQPEPAVARSTGLADGARPSRAEARAEPDATTSAARRKAPAARPRRSSKQARAAHQGAEAALPPVDINGRPIRMTLESSP